MKKAKEPERVYIGGQAVMEGVMMRGKKCYAVSVRAGDGQIKTDKKFTAKRKNKVLKLPVIRGVASFVDSVYFGVKLIHDSADMAGIDLKEENPTKFDKWLEKVFGDKLFNVIMGFSAVIGIVFAIVLFMLLPAWGAGFFYGMAPDWLMGALEGFIKITLFVAYISVISFYPDIRRVFQYHGAEHKTINCHESGLPLTVENVKEKSRLHKRCGTSFLLIVMLVSIIFFSFLIIKNIWLRLFTRLILIPLIAGLSYEIIMLAGKRDNFILRIVSFPGLMLQKLTTKEPDDKQIEVAITAMTAVLEDEA